MSTILLYRANDRAVSDDAARWYMKCVEGEEEAVAAAGCEDGGPQFRNDGCLLCREEAKERIW